VVLGRVFADPRPARTQLGEENGLEEAFGMDQAGGFWNR
jgi:hypothetical protein